MHSLLLALAAATAVTPAPVAGTTGIERSPGTVVQFGEGRTAEMYAGHRASSPEDKREWLTLRLGEVGLIVVSDDGKSEILSVDKFGGVYINGDLYVKGEKVGAGAAAVSAASPDAAAASTPSGIGWLQLLLVAIATAVVSVLVSTNISKHQAR